VYELTTSSHDAIPRRRLRADPRSTSGAAGRLLIAIFLLTFDPMSIEHWFRKNEVLPVH